VRHYSIRTEDCYADRVRRFILFQGKGHPQEMGAAEINAFLTHPAVEGRVSASTQNQAFSAILFLYHKVLEVDPGQIAGVVRANRPKRLPVVLTRHEVRAVLAILDGTYRLMGQSRGREHDDDRHPCVDQGRSRGDESPGRDRPAQGP
jgi:hypothetical protein